MNDSTKDRLKRRLLFCLLMLSALGCGVLPQPSPTSPSVTHEASPQPATATLKREATVVPVTTPTPTAIATVAPPPSPTATTMLTAKKTADGKVYLGDQLLLDVAQDAPGCFGIGPIAYSPVGKYFVVVADCFEGDNEAFLFRADGSGRQRLTTQWDFINYYDFEWAADGSAFIYRRINSCCAVPPPEAPVPGRVQYDVQTGAKTVVSRYQVVNVASNDTLNVRSGPGTSNPAVGQIPFDGMGIEITGQGVLVRSALWVSVRYAELTGWVNRDYLAEQAGQ